MATTLTPVGTSPTTRPSLPWDGIFDTPDEVDAAVTDVEGRLPAGLVGTLYRNGPGKLDVAQHLFDGDGMISAIGFGADGDVHFRNRFVRTPKYLAELRATKPKVSGYGTLAAGGRLRNAFRPPSAKSSAANTNLMFTSGRLLALWEAGHPWQVDPDTLATLGEMDFDGALEARLPFSAHPHWDPHTGEIFNFGMVYGPRNSVAAYRIDRAGRLSSMGMHRVPDGVMNHDFIVTSKWLVFFLNPLKLRVLKLLSGSAAFGDALEFDDRGATLVLLIPRDGGQPVFIEAEPWFQFHFGAAFDDGDDVVVDVVRYPSYEPLGSSLKHFRTSDFSGAPGTLQRIRITPSTKRVEARPLSDLGMEFPQVDWSRATGGYRHVYGAVIPRGGGLFSGIGRIDTETGAADDYYFGAGRIVTEPLFVPRDGGSDGDGWLLALVYDPARRASDAVVLDARDIGAGPVFTAHLPVNTGLSFHGTWRRAN